jgi:hypothetical protein
MLSRDLMPYSLEFFGENFPLYLQVRRTHRTWYAFITNTCLFLAGQTL